MTRILLVDDHAMVRQGLRAVLQSQPGWEVCGEATNGREAMEKARQLKPDVVVLDLSLPELNGLEVTRQLRKALPRTEVLILTMHESEQMIREVLAAGARGYLLKTDAGHTLVTAVDHVRKHKPFFTSKVAAMVLEGYLKPKAATASDSGTSGLLTSRERQIVQLIAEGKTSKEIAVTLNLSVKTVDTHRSNLMRKLSVHSLSELVRFAVRNRIVEP